MDGVELLHCGCQHIHKHQGTAPTHTKELDSNCRTRLFPDQTGQPCQRHYTRCKPSRRRYPSWRCWGEIYELVICVCGLFSSGVCNGLFTNQRTKPGMLLRIWVMFSLFGVFLHFPLCKADSNLEPAPHNQLPSVVAPVGSAFVYSIPDGGFGCKVDKFVVSETADRYLSPWLAYEEDKKQIYGVPSEKDRGTLDILVVALTKSETGNAGRICGSKSFTITVVSLSDELPVSVNLADSSRTPPLHFQQTEAAADMLCAPGMPVVLGTVLIGVDLHSLNGHERTSAILNMAEHLNTTSKKVSMFSGDSPHPLVQQLDQPSLVIAGAGDGRFVKGPRSLLTWRITCGAIKLKDAALSRVENSARDGTLSSLLGFPVASWHVMSGTQKSIVRRRARRAIAANCPGCTPTPSATIAPPTRILNISTTTIVAANTSVIAVLSSSVTTPAMNSTVLPVSSVPSSVVFVSSSPVLPSPSSPDATFSPSSFTGLPVTLSSEAGNTSTLIGSIPVVTNSTRVTQASLTFAVTATPPATQNVSIATSTAVNSTRMSSSRTAITHSQPLISTSLAPSTAQGTKTPDSSFTSPRATPVPTPSSVAMVTQSPLMNVSSTLLFETSAKISSAAGTFISSKMPFSSSLVDSKMPNSTAPTAASNSTVPGVFSSLISPTIGSSLEMDSRRTSLTTNFTSRTPGAALSTLFTTRVSARQSTVTTVATRTFASPTLVPTSALNVSSLREETPASSQVANSTVESKSTKLSTAAVTRSGVKSVITRSTTPMFESTTERLASSLNVSTVETARSVATSSASPLRTRPIVSTTRVAAENSTLALTSEVATQPAQASPSTTAVKLPSSGSASDVPTVSSKGQSFSGTLVVVSTARSSVVEQTAGSTTGRLPSSVLTEQTSAPTTVTVVQSSDVTANLLTTVMTSTTALSRNSSAAVSTDSVMASSDVIRSSSPSTSVTHSPIVTQGSPSSSPSRSTFIFTFGSSSSSVYMDTSTTFTPSRITSRKTHETFVTSVTLVPSSASLSRFHSITVAASVPSLDIYSSPVVSSSATPRVSASSGIPGVTQVKSSEKSPTVPHSHGVSTSSRASFAHQTVITELPSSKLTSKVSDASQTAPVSSVAPNITRVASSTERVAASRSSGASADPSVSSTFTETPSSLEHSFLSQIPSSSHDFRASSAHRMPDITRFPSSSEHVTFTSQVPSSPSRQSRPFASSVTPVSFVVGATSFPSSVLTSTVTTTNTTSLTPTPTSTTTVRPTTAPPNSGPVVVNNLGRVTARVGKALDYPIPNDTFYDREDQADAWQLKLRVLYLDNKPIPADYWLQFDSAGRRLYGLPSEKDAEALGDRGEEFVLVASDSRGEEGYDAFDVYIDADRRPVAQRLSVTTNNDYTKFSANVSLRLRLLDKIATYYGDTDNGNIRVLSTAPGSVIFVWTNDSLPTSECDVERVDYIANKVVLENGAVNSEFVRALEPEFPVVTASEARLGVCNGSDVKPTEPVLGRVSRSASELWYMYVLTGLLVVVLLIIIAVLLVRRLRRNKPKPFKPEKRTYKKRKPIILNPEIELKEFPGKPLVLPNDDPSQPPSYMSETSLDRSPRYYYSDDEDEDEEDFGRKSPSPPTYEPPPPFYADEEPRSLPPPMYAMPPLFFKK